MALTHRDELTPKNLVDMLGGRRIEPRVELSQEVVISVDLGRQITQLPTP